MEKPTYSIVTFGCQMNVHDSALLEGLMEEAGYTRADEAEPDVVLFNTCSVRAHAEEKALSRVGALKNRKERDGAVVGVVGCMAQREGERLFRLLPHVGLVCGTADLGRIVELVERARSGARVLALGGPSPAEGLRPAGGTAALPPSCRAKRKTRFSAYLSVMRGCSNNCSYCVVPSARGPARSRAVDEVLDDARRLVDSGAVEITLLGQSVDSWGKDLPGRPPFDDLLARAAETPGLKRLKFITSHPRDVRPELFCVMAEHPNVVRYLHMPAQSGADRVLARMRRGYTRAEYVDKVLAARERVPGLGVASDFICGFPGETDGDFELTLSLMEEIRFQNGYFFKYSPRPGTEAASWPDDVPPETKRRRHARMLELQKSIQLELNRALVGREVEVLIESPNRRKGEGGWMGRTETNRIAVLKGEAREGDVVRARVRDATSLTLRCELVEGWGPR